MGTLDLVCLGRADYYFSVSLHMTTKENDGSDKDDDEERPRESQGLGDYSFQAMQDLERQSALATAERSADAPTLNPESLSVGQVAADLGINHLPMRNEMPEDPNDHHGRNEYFTFKYFTASDPQGRQEALNSLTTEILGNRNLSAQFVLDQLTLVDSVQQLNHALATKDTGLEQAALRRLIALDNLDPKNSEGSVKKILASYKDADDATDPRDKVHQRAVRGLRLAAIIDDSKGGRPGVDGVRVRTPGGDGPGDGIRPAIPPEAIALEGLLDAVKEDAAKRSASVEPRKDAFAAFLAPQATPAERATALTSMEQQGAARIRDEHSTDVLVNLNWAKATHRVLAVHAASTPQAAAEALRELKTLAQDNLNNRAREALNDLAAAGDVDELIQKLADGDEEALRAVQALLKDPSAEIAEQRMTNAIAGLDKDSTTEQWQKAIDRLEVDAQNNAPTKDWLDWAKTGRAVKNYVDANGDPIKCHQILKDLQDEAKSGNAHARHALASFLASAENNDQARQWLAEPKTVNGKQAFILPVSEAQKQDSAVLIETASATRCAIFDSQKSTNKTLSPSENDALAISNRNAAIERNADGRIESVSVNSESFKLGYSEDGRLKSVTTPTTSRWTEDGGKTWKEKSTDAPDDEGRAWNGSMEVFSDGTIAETNYVDGSVTMHFPPGDTLTRDKAGLLTEQQQADGTWDRSTWDQGAIKTKQHGTRDGFSTTTDNSGKVLERRMPDGNWVQATRDNAGQINEVSDSKGLRLIRNAQGQMVTPDGTTSYKETTVETDGTVRLKTADGKETRRNPDGSSLTTDAAGNILERVNKDGSSVSYDGHRRVSATKDTDGKVTEYSFGADGQPEKIKESDGSVWTSADNKTWQKQGSTDTRNGAVRIESDGSRVTTNDGTVTVAKVDGSLLKKDEKGNLTSITDRAGRSSTLEYSPTNQLNRVTLPDGTVLRTQDGTKWFNEKTQADLNGSVSLMPDGTISVKSKDEHQSDKTVDWRTDGTKVVSSGNSVEIVNTKPDGSQVITDSNNRIKQTVDKTGGTTSYFYNAQGALDYVSAPDGTWTSVDGKNWRERGSNETIAARIEVKVDGTRVHHLEGGATVEYRTDGTSLTKNKDGKVTETNDAQGIRRRYEYDEQGRLNAYTNTTNGLYSQRWTSADGKTWKCDPPDMISRQRRPQQPDWLGKIDVDGNGALHQTAQDTGITHVTSMDGTASGIDSLGKARYEQKPDGSYSSNEYAEGGELLSSRSRDHAGNVLEKDGQGHLTKCTFANGQWRRFDRDAEGKVKSIVESNGSTWSSADGKTYRNSKTGESITGTLETGPDGSYTWRRADNSEVTVRAGEQTTSIKDGRGRLRETTTAEGARVAYDEQGRVTETTDPAGKKRVFSYGANGLNQIQETDGSIWTANADRTAWTKLGTTQAVPGERSVSNDGTYVVKEPNGITRSHLPSGGAITRDTQGRIAATTDIQGKIREFTYTEQGQLKSVKRPDGTTISTTDGREWVDSKTGEKFTASIDLGTDGSLVQHHGGLSEKITRDRLDGSVETREKGKPASFEYLGKDGSRLVKDEQGRLTQILNANGYTRQFTYNSDNQIVGVRDGSWNENGVSWNRQWTSQDGSTWTSQGHEWKGRVELHPDGTYNTFDSEGNRSITRPNGTAITFDKDNRPIGVVRSDGKSASGEYGPDGKLNKFTENGVTWTSDDGGKNWKAGQRTYSGAVEITPDGDVKYGGTPPHTIRADNTVVTETKEGSVRVVTESKGDRQTVSRFSQRGDLLTKTEQLGDKSEVTSDKNGNVIKVLAANGQWRAFERGPQGFVTTIRESNGNILTSTDGKRFQKQGTNEVIEGVPVLERDGSCTFKAADGTITKRQMNGETTVHRSETVVSTTAADGRKLKHDDQQRIIETVDAQGNKRLFGYTDGKLATITEPNGTILSSTDGINFKHSGGPSPRADIEGKYELKPDGSLVLTRKVVTDVLYQRLLNRAPDAGAKWVTDMIQNGSNYRDLVKSLINNPVGEFRKSIPTNQAEVVPFLYARLLDRKTPPSPQEIAGWNTLLATKGVDAVIDGILNSAEFASKSPRPDQRQSVRGIDGSVVELDQSGRVESTTANGQTTTFKYGADNKLNFVKYPDGSSWKLTGDQLWTHEGTKQTWRGQLTVEANGTVRQHPTGASETIISPDGWTRTDDRGGARTHRRNPDGSGVEKNERGEVTQAWDKNGAWRRFERDAQGRVARVVDSNGTEWTRSADGRTMQLRGSQDKFPIDQLVVGNDGSFSFQSGTERLRNNVDGSVSRLDGQGRERLRGNTDGSQLMFDEQGRVIGTLDPAGKRRGYTYANGILTGILEPDGSVWKSTDATNWQKAGSPERRTGLVTVGTDGSQTVRTQRGEETTFKLDGSTVSRDKDGRVTSVKDADGKMRRFEYNQQGTVVTVREPDGKVWKSPDGQNWTTEGPTKATAKRTITVDRDGTVREKSDGGKEVAKRTDGWHEITENGATRLEHTEENGAVVTKNKQGQTTDVKYPNGTARTFKYDGDGRLAVFTDNRGTWVTNDGRSWTNAATQQKWRGTAEVGEHGILSVRSEDGSQRIFKSDGSSIQTDTAGRATDLTAANGHNRQFVYGADGKLSRMKDSTGTWWTNTEGDKWKKDGAGTAPTDTWEGRVTIRPDGTYEQVSKAGVRTLAPTDGKVASFDATGKMIQSIAPDGRSTTYQYDAQGKPTTFEVKNLDATTITYNQTGQVKSTKDINGKVREFAYGADGKINEMKYDGVTWSTQDGKSWRSSAGEGWQGQCYTTPDGQLNIYDGHTLKTYQLDGNTMFRHDNGATRLLNAKNQTIETVDSKSFKRSYAYNEAGQVVRHQEGNEVWQRHEGNRWTRNTDNAVWHGEVSILGDGSYYHQDSNGSRQWRKPDGSREEVDHNEMEKACKAINDSTYFGITTGGTDEDQFHGALENKTVRQRQMMDEIYQAKYGKSIRAEAKAEMSGHHLEKALALLDKPDGADNAGTIRVALTELDQVLYGRSDTECQRVIRDTLETMSEAEIQEADRQYQKRYGHSLRDEVMNSPNLSQKTKEACDVYLKGHDKRTGDDVIALAKKACDNGDATMFQEAMRRAPKQARDYFTGEEGQRLMRYSFEGHWYHALTFGLTGNVTDTELRHVTDYAEYGKLSVSTQVKDNTSWLGDNEAAIEQALFKMTPEEREAYRLGRIIARGETPDKPLTPDQAQRHRAYYDKTFAALNTAAGVWFSGDSQRNELSKWEDMILQKGGSLISRLADHKGMIYDSSMHDVIATIENMPEEDWKRLKTDPDYRQRLDGVLNTYLNESEKNRCTAIINEKLAATSFEQSQQSRRPVMEVIDDNRRWYNNDEDNIYRAIENMTKSELDLYRKGREAGCTDKAALDFANGLDEKLRGCLDSDEQKVAFGLLAKVERGEKPEMSILDKLNIQATYTFGGDDAQIIRDIQQAFAKDPALRQRITNPQTDADRDYSRQFHDAARRAMGSSDYNKYAKPLIETGRLSIELQLDLNRGYFNDDEQGAYRDVVNASADEKQRVLTDRAFQDRVLGFLSANERQVALYTMQQGGMRPEDKLRSYMIGVGTSEDEIKQVFKELRDREAYKRKGVPEAQIDAAIRSALDEVKRDYARKYGTDLSADLISELGGKDLAQAQRDLHLRDPRSEFLFAREQAGRSRSGFGSSFVDNCWDGTGYQLDDEINQLAKIMVEDPNKVKDCVENLYKAMELHAESKEALADAVCDTVIAAVGIGGAFFTGGVSLSLLAYTGAAAAVFKVGTKITIMGGDYDAASTQILLDGATGFADGFTTFLGAGAAKAACKKTLEAGGKAMLKEGVEQSFKEATEALVKQGLKDGGKLSDDAIKALAVQMAKEGQADAFAALLKKSLGEAIEAQARSMLKQMVLQTPTNVLAGMAGGGASGTIRAGFEARTGEEFLTRAGMSAGFGAFGGGAAPFVIAPIAVGAGKAWKAARSFLGRVDDTADNLAARVGANAGDHPVTPHPEGTPVTPRPDGTPPPPHQEGTPTPRLDAPAPTVHPPAEVHAPLSPAAAASSNEFATGHQLDKPIPDGFTTAGAGNRIDANGRFDAHRAAVVVDRQKDAVLKDTIQEANTHLTQLARDKGRALTPEEKMAALTDFVAGKFRNSRGDSLEADKLFQDMYATFMKENAGKRVMLGDFLANGLGGCTEQALLLKVLADDLGVPGAKLVRGNGTGGSDSFNHMWVAVDNGGKPQIYDPRQGILGKPATEVTTHTHGSDMQAAAGGSLPDRSFNPGDNVDYGANGWKVVRETLDGKVVLAHDGARVLSPQQAASLAELNPEIAQNGIVVGNSYRIRRPDGVVEDGWVVTGMKDGQVQLGKKNAVEITVPRSELFKQLPEMANDTLAHLRTDLTRLQGTVGLVTGVNAAEAKQLVDNFTEQLRKLSPADAEIALRQFQRGIAAAPDEAISRLRLLKEASDAAGTKVNVDARLFTNPDVPDSYPVGATNVNPRREYIDAIKRLATVEKDFPHLTAADRGPIEEALRQRIQRFHKIAEGSGDLEPALRIACAKLDEMKQVADLLASRTMTPTQVGDIRKLLEMSGDHQDIVVPFKTLFHANAKPDAVKMYMELLKQTTFDTGATTLPKGGFNYEGKVTPELQRALAANDGTILPEGWVFVPSSHNSTADGIGLDGVLINTHSNPPQILPVDFAMDSRTLAKKVLEGKGMWAVSIPPSDLSDPSKVLAHLKSYAEGKTNQDAAAFVRSMEARLRELGSNSNATYGANDVREALNNLRAWLRPQLDPATAATLATMDQTTLLATAQGCIAKGPVAPGSRPSLPLTDFPSGAGGVPGSTDPFWPSFRAVLTKEEADALGKLPTWKEATELIAQLDAKLADPNLDPSLRRAYQHLRERTGNSAKFREFEHKTAEAVSADLGRAVDIHVNASPRGVGSDVAPGPGRVGQNTHGDAYVEFDKTIPLPSGQRVDKVRVYENGLVVGVGQPNAKGDETLIELGNIRELLSRNKRLNTTPTASDELQAMLSRMPREGNMFNLKDGRGGLRPYADVIRESDSLRLMAAACDASQASSLGSRATTSLKEFQTLQQIKAAIDQKHMPQMNDAELRQFVKTVMEARAELNDNTLTPAMIKNLADLRKTNGFANFKEVRALEQINADAALAALPAAEKVDLAKKVTQMAVERPAFKLQDVADLSKKLGPDWDVRREFLDIMAAESAKPAKISKRASDADRVSLAKDLHAARATADPNINPARILELLAIKNEAGMPPGVTWKELDQIRQLKPTMTNLSGVEAYWTISVKRQFPTLDNADARALAKEIGVNTPLPEFNAAMAELTTMQTLNNTMTLKQLESARKLIAGIEAEAAAFEIATTPDLRRKAAIWMVQNGKKDLAEGVGAIESGVVK